MTKKAVSTGTVEQLPVSGCPQQTNIHSSCRSYWIIINIIMEFLVHLLH